MGGHSREIVLSEESAADFLDLASGGDAFIVQVAHVHGRATEHDHLVVTDADYQKAYVGDDQGKISAREGLEVLFGGNPVVFVGLSLAEGDVMRPLREFTAAGSHFRRNNSIFAIKEASRSKVERDAFALQQFVRHRVYVEYYGFTNSDLKRRGDSWINAFSEYIDLLRTIATNFLIVKDVNTEPGETTRLSLKKITKNHQRELERLRARLADSLALDSKSVPPRTPLKSDGGDCDIRLEISIALRIEELLRSIAGSKVNSGGSLKVFLEKLLPSILKRIEGAAFTVGLTAFLQGLRSDWQRWADDWLTPSQLRTSEKNIPPGRIAPVHPADFDTKRRRFSEALREEYPHYKARWSRHLPDPCAAIRDVTKQFDSVEGMNCSHGFIDFIEAIKGRPLRGADRRVIFVTGSRGAGKGAIFEDLARMGDYLLCPEQLSDASKKTESPTQRYCAGFFGSFVFSSEATSIWDALAEFLQDPYSEKAGGDYKPRPERFGELGRLQRIEWGMTSAENTLKVAAENIKHQPKASESVVLLSRALVVLHGFDLLFDSAGAAKNSEIRSIFMMLVDERFTAVPIDVILITRTDRLPAYFRKQSDLIHYLRALAAADFMFPRFDPPREAGELILLKNSARQVSPKEIVSNSRESDRIRGIYTLSGINVISDESTKFTELQKECGGRYFYSLPSRTADYTEETSTLAIPESLSEHRYLATLCKRVGQVEHFIKTIKQSIDSRAHVQPDEIINHILDYWAYRSQQLATDGKNAYSDYLDDWWIRSWNVCR